MDATDSVFTVATASTTNVTVTMAGGDIGDGDTGSLFIATPVRVHGGITKNKLYGFGVYGLIEQPYTSYDKTS